MKENDNKEFENEIDEEILDADYEQVEESDEENEKKSNKDTNVDEVIEDSDDLVESEELRNQLIRLQADFSNYKKRMEKEREGYIDLGVKKLALDILPVIDNLERALKSIEEYANDDEIFKGINLIDDQLLEVLAKNNITEIKANGEKFDPNLHHAVAMVDSEDLESDMIVDVLQKGYQINESVLRPSMVRVSK